MRRASLALLCLALGWGAVELARAQTSLASLERRSSRRPDDTSLLCQLGWARFLDGQSGSVAATPLDRAITLLGEPTEPALRNRLAACLYNRGRVHELVGSPDQAVAAYERSLSLRPNDVVTRRRAELLARRAVAWRGADGELGEADRRALARALDVEVTRVDVDARRVSPDGADQAVVVRDGDIHLAVRTRDGAWSVARLGELLDTNGEERLSLEVGPGPAGRGPTFVVSYFWSHRDCCDDEGLPDWSEGTYRYLVWRDAGRWIVAEVPDDEELTIASDGRVLVGRRETARARESFRTP